MDVMLVVIVLAILATVVTMFLGLLAMGGGGTADKEFGTSLMWTRIGFQALTLGLLVLAVVLR
ncbi:MAG TPA: HIG1 domain-containing protein [Povalibacter sp.]|jgi:hypothetical protein